MSTEEKDKGATEAPVDTADDFAAHHGDEPLVAESDRPNVGVISVVTFAISALVVVVVIGVYELFRQTFQAEITKKQLEWVDPQLRELRAYEQANLSKYQWVSQKDGVVRMPLSRARELVLAEYAKTAAYVPGGAPAPAPAPEGSVAPEGSAAPAESAAPAPSASAPVPAGSETAPEGSASAPAPGAPAPQPH